jgi:ferritin-like metal-binding protein YciE
MGWFSDDIETMEHLFVHSLQDIYYAEQQIEKALPDMSRRRQTPS